MTYPDVSPVRNITGNVISVNPLEQLFKFDLFQGLNPVQRSKIRSSIRAIRLRQGQTLFEQGAAAKTFYFVVRGWVTLYRLHESGAITVFHVCGANESFGEVAALTMDSYPITAEAATDTIIFAIPAGAYRFLIEQDASFALRVIQGLERRVRNLINDFERCQHVSGANRLASFLLELTRRTRSDNGHYKLPFSKQTLAGLLHIQPETLSRAFSELRKYGVQCTRNGCVHIPDLRLLDTYLREQRQDRH